MMFIPTALPGVIIVEPQVYRDERGFFLETYQREKYLKGNIDAVFVQDNHSRSVRGTLRGLHAQLHRPQGKLIRVIEGEIYDVAVDIRRGSPHFGRWIGVWLSSDNFRQVYLPPGFAHGFCVASEFAQVEYKVSNYYDPAGEISVQWNDPEIGVNWPADIVIAPILSQKDLAAKPLRELMDVLPFFTDPS
ncbi:MAG: dTDP-4-dehydrorhamnose 3,5-epimerase [Blastocatellia bacterium]|nr:dTDP-4-dehydrorhamnose 3,5-epimerase [Blastocatellia bacterium]